MPTVAVTNTSPSEHADSDDSADSPPEPAGGPIRHSQSPGEADCVEIIRASGVRASINTDWLQEKLVAACAKVHRPVERLALRIVADAEMARLHEQHAGVQGTTDVLTFDTPGEAVDVDIAVCADEASRRAEELGHTVERELLLYAVHGLLHCLGFDDHSEADYQRMHAEEDRLLEAIGVGRTFANPDHARRSDES